MPTGVEELVGAVAGTIASTIAFVQSLAGEAWTRYFIILAALGFDTFIGNLVGLFPLESVLEFVAQNLFGIAEFTFPIFYGVSSLFLITAVMPVAFFLLKMALSIALHKQ
jgi:hypothetical protein